MRKFEFILGICVAALSIAALGAQSLPSPEDPIWHYESWLETAGLAEVGGMGLRSIDTPFVDEGGPWAGMFRERKVESADSFVPTFEGFTAEAGTTWNSSYPTSVNIGGLWEGRGLTPWVNSTVEGTLGPFYARLGASASYSQNLDFPLGPSGLTDQPLASVDGAVIDTPQRYGTQPFSLFSLSNWEFRATFGPFVASFSDQNLWFGPAVFNPLLLSSQAQGFPHIRLGLEDWKTPIGDFESQLVYGQLVNSQYWDPSVNDGDRFFGGLFIGYTPSFFPQFTLGAGRTVISYWNNLDWKVPVVLFIPGTSDAAGSLGNLFGYGTGESHQHISITWRLKFDSVGFETYGEWGKNDFSPPRLYLINPEHMQAYTLGMKKSFALPKNTLLGIGAELTDLAQSQESLINYNGYGWSGDWYAHGAIREGYTNDGQVLGASIGNGSTAQILYADYYAGFGHIGFELRRWANRLLGLYLGPLPLTGSNAREYETDVEYDIGLRGDVPVGPVMYSLSVQYQYDNDRYMIAYNDVVNWHVSFTTSLKL